MRAVLLGAGWIARKIYIPALLDSGNIDEIIVVDPAPGGDLPSGRVRHASLEEAAARRADWAFVLSPNHLHCDHLLAAMEFAPDIFVEKPACLGRREAERIQAAAERMRPRVQVSAPFRLRRDLQDLRTLLRSGEIGRVYGTELRWCKKRGVPGSPWFCERGRAGGGALIDMGPHLLDLHRWLVGRSAERGCTSLTVDLDPADNSVFASWHRGSATERLEATVEAAAYSQMLFEDSFLRLDVAWVSPVERDMAQLRFVGTRGALDLETALGFSTDTLVQGSSFKLTSADSTREWRSEIGDRSQLFVDGVTRMVRGETVEFPPLSEGLAVAVQIEQLYASAGRTV